MTQESKAAAIVSSAKHPFIITPAWDGELGKYQYPHIEVKHVPGTKMLGVFATRDLPKYTRIPYLGRVIEGADAVARWRKELKEHYAGDPDRHHQRISYIVGKGADLEIDACPRVFGTVGGRGLYIGGIVNEPNSRTKANADWVIPPRPAQLSLVARDGKSNARNVYAWIALARPVKAGEQITVHYGDEYVRVGYRAGQRARLSRLR